ncbi:MAG: type II toxin-antitoxin system VapC family toxin [Planctomycetia bacterium]
MLILDANHLSEMLNPISSSGESLRRKLRTCNEDVVITIITVEESLRGWLQFIHRAKSAEAQIRPYTELKRQVAVFAKWRILQFDAAAAELLAALRVQHRRIGTMDLKIASIALSWNAKVLTRNLRDFKAIDGLNAEDWLI